MKEERESALTVNLVIRVSPKEKALIEKYAKKEGWTISEYVRATMVTDMAMMHQDVEAMKIVFDSAKQKLARSFFQKFKPLRGEKVRVSG